MRSTKVQLPQLQSTCFEMNVPEQFSIMHNSTLCLNEAQRAAVFNGLCHTLHERWFIAREMLSKQMENYGYEYTENP